MRLEGKKIILGITGSIAAYKSTYLVRLLKKEGADVQVIMTKSTVDFVTPLTLSTLSQRPVLIEPFDMKTGQWTSHIDLGSWADMIVMAPLSANTMSKMANGMADNLLLAVYLAARCPVIIAPAMDVDMFEHKATQRNLERLVADGCMLIEPASGELASGLIGKGRMEEPQGIAEFVITCFCKKKV